MNRVWTLAAALVVTASLAVTLAFQSHANQAAGQEATRPVMMYQGASGGYMYVCTGGYLYKVDCYEMKVVGSVCLTPIRSTGWVGGGGPVPGK